MPKHCKSDFTKSSGIKFNQHVKKSKKDSLAVNCEDNLVFTNQEGQTTNLTCSSLPLPSKLVNPVAEYVNPGATEYPPDPNIAVGPESIMLVTNSNITILDKKTQQSFFNQNLNLFIQYPNNDCSCLYDELSQRFFVGTWGGLPIDSQVTITTGSAVGTYKAAKGGATKSSFRVPKEGGTVSIVAADPPSADTKLTNEKDINGNIALIATDGFKTGSLNKGNNAASAGAIGALFYASTPIDFIDILGSDQIPSVIIDYLDGQKIVSSMKLGGIKGSMENLNNIYGLNIFYLAVSKNSNPRNADDFYYYNYNMRLDNYPLVAADFPKLGIDQHTIYHATEDENFITGEYYFADIISFDKEKAISGTGLNETNRKLLSDSWFQWPAQIRTPLSDALQTTVFVGFPINSPPPHFPPYLPNIIDTVRVYFPPNGIISDYTFIDVPIQSLKENPVDSYVEQPADVPPIENQPGIGLPPVVFQNSLFFCISYNPTPNIPIIRWFEFDLSLALTSQIISIKQFGDVNALGHGSADPAINIDNEGNLSIGFTIGSKSLPPSTAIVTRRYSDPPGYTTPAQIIHNGIYSYNGANEPRSPTLVINRWGDYTFLIVDPENGKDFYYFNEIPSPLPEIPGIKPIDYENMISYAWSTILYKYQVNSCGPTKLGDSPKNNSNAIQSKGKREGISKKRIEEIKKGNSIEKAGNPIEKSDKSLYPKMRRSLRYR